MPRIHIYYNDDLTIAYWRIMAEWQVRSFESDELRSRLRSESNALSVPSKLPCKKATILSVLSKRSSLSLTLSSQTETYASTLSSSLDGKVFVGTSCMKPLPTLVIIDEYTAENDQATHAFMSTGTYAEIYDGMLCTDGGMTTGPKMTPLFQDSVRPQLIVDLMATGYPSDMVYRVDFDQYASLIEDGMDEMESFLVEGKTERDGIITLCPVGADVSGFVCK